MINLSLLPTNTKQAKASTLPPTVGAGRPSETPAGGLFVFSPPSPCCFDWLIDPYRETERDCEMSVRSDRRMGWNEVGGFVPREIDRDRDRAPEERSRSFLGLEGACLHHLLLSSDCCSLSTCSLLVWWDCVQFAADAETPRFAGD